MSDELRAVIDFINQPLLDQIFKILGEKEQKSIDTVREAMEAIAEDNYEHQFDPVEHQQTISDSEDLGKKYRVAKYKNGSTKLCTKCSGFISWDLFQIDLHHYISIKRFIINDGNCPEFGK